jgi:hypothetical protein
MDKGSSQFESPSAATRDTTKAGFELPARPGQVPRDSGTVAEEGL